MLTSLLFVGLAQADADSEQVKKKFETLMPTIKLDSVEPLGDTGLYEAVVKGEIFYLSSDARYLFQGDVIALESRENLTENKRTGLRKDLLSSADEKDMIIYEPKETKYTVTVFTDIDCGYCRKLHQQMDGYNDLGIRIRYMAYPRAGIGSESYNKAVSVWCDKDRKQALTDAKAGMDLDEVTCDNPVEQQYDLGHRLGVTGTPALFLDSGLLLPGYIPPKRLIEVLDQQVAKDS